MSTGRTMTLPGVDMENWLSSIDPQKHGTVFSSVGAVGHADVKLSCSTSVLQSAAAHFVARLCFSLFFPPLHLPNCWWDEI